MVTIVQCNLWLCARSWALRKIASRLAAHNYSTNDAKPKGPRRLSAADDVVGDKVGKEVGNEVGNEVGDKVGNKVGEVRD